MKTGKRKLMGWFLCKGQLQAEPPSLDKVIESGDFLIPLALAAAKRAFANNLKKYGKTAGFDRLHQTWHSYARIIAEEAGSITDREDASGHCNDTITRIIYKGS